MASKDFSNIGKSSIVGDIRTATHTPQSEITEEELHARRAAGKTQGRAGAKMLRLNMAFTEENSEFIRVVARVTGRSMTQVTNQIVKEYRENNPEIFEIAKDAEQKIAALTAKSK